MTFAVSPVERLLQRDGAITLAGLFLLWALTWAWVVAGAGLGMSAWDMTLMVLLPDHPMPMMPGMDGGPPAPTWDPGYWALMVGMWWAMMVAMMAPSAAPTILLFARVHRHTVAQGRLVASPAPTGAFVAGYFLAWGAFSVAATALHQALEDADIVSAMTMGSRVPWVSAGALIVTGVYQLSPWKNTCLSHCRAPAEFLSRHWRPGASGALRLGVLHGTYCIGCCWLLMVLLFVGGVMNLAWIAALSLLVLAEIVLPRGPWVSRVAGVVLIAWGAAILLQAT